MDKIAGNKLRKVIIYIILINCLLPNAGGANPWSAFNVSSNASDFGLSRANISEGTKGFYQFSNPALLPQSKEISLGMSYTMMSLDRSTQVISFNMPLPPQAAIGLSMMRSGTSNIQGKDGVNNKTDIISDYEMLGVISFGVSFSQNISVGVNIKASYANLDDVIGGTNEPGYSISSKGIGFDGGILFKSNIGSVGVKAENIESSKNWNYRQEEELIPIIYKIGGHYQVSKTFFVYACRDIYSLNSENSYYNILYLYD